jgi:glycosyltransferase involved in cell wall biosynthesis
MAVLEAMGSAIPVVASDIPAHREAMDGWGVLFDVDDVDGLAKGLQAALDDPGMGEKAKEVIVRRGYDWDEIVARTFKVIAGPSKNA